ncbi:major facilitator superfamily domain-containing protein [Lentinula raphanica]|nr:major facilitator superfamily domain-containing protein [Lentinula raphanica]
MMEMKQESILLTAAENVAFKRNVSTDFTTPEDNANAQANDHEERHDVDPFEVPDGGARAWLCVFGGFMISITCYGVANTFGVFEDFYSANQLSAQSLNNISWIGSLQLCLILLVGCVSGPLCDAGYFKHLIGTGGLLFFFCLMMTSISTEYYQYLLSQGVGVGLAQGLLFTPGMAVLAHHFKHYRTLVFGIFAAGASIGGVILPIALQRLFDEVGFVWGVRILAFIVIACVGTGFVCCTTRFPPRKGGRVLDIRVCELTP